MMHRSVLRGLLFASPWIVGFVLFQLVPVVAATYIWRWLLNAQYGYVNGALGAVGLGQPLWLDDPFWTKPALILMSLWVTGSAMVVFLAALQDVPETYYEAAVIDGAGPWAKFRHVTLPLISPVILFETIIAGIFTLQYFTQAFLLGQTRLNAASGGPENSLLVYGLYLFQQAFVNLNMGYASAMAWVLLFVALAGTWLLLRVSRDRVFYAGD